MCDRSCRLSLDSSALSTPRSALPALLFLSIRHTSTNESSLSLSPSSLLSCRTKWKRQTAVGLELLAEAGNYAAFQRLYGGASPYLSAWPYAAAAAAQTPHGAPPSAIDIYYRQAAAAAALQKPALPAASYGIYPSSRMPPGMTLPGMPPPPGGYYAPPPVPPPPLPTLGANAPQRERSPATSHSANSEADYERSSSSRQRLQTPSPPLNPGSPPPRREAMGGEGEVLTEHVGGQEEQAGVEEDGGEIEHDEGDEEDEELALEV